MVFEGQNIVVEYRVIDNPRGPFVGAAELMRTQPDLVVAIGPEVALQAVVGASAHIPIVMLAVNYDPIERGYVVNLAQPGGNITGVVVRPIELARKQIDLLRQTFPDRDRLAMLYDAQTADQFTAANQAAKSLNLQVQALKLEIPSYDFAGAFQAAAAGGAQLMMVLSSPSFTKHRDATCRACHQTPPAYHVHLQALRRWRWVNVLWCRTSAYVAPNRGLCGANSEGCETGRTADRAAHQIRVGGQS